MPRVDALRVREPGWSMCSAGNLPAVDGRIAAISSGVRRARSSIRENPSVPEALLEYTAYTVIFRKSSPDCPVRLGLGSPRCVIWCSVAAVRVSSAGLGRR